MARSPDYKVYSATGEYIGCAKHVEYAAAMVSLLGQGATIRLGHESKYTLWTEGVDGDAHESWDAVAELAISRMPRAVA